IQDDTFSVRLLTFCQNANLKESWSIVPKTRLRTEPSDGSCLIGDSCLSLYSVNCSDVDVSVNSQISLPHIAGNPFISALAKKRLTVIFSPDAIPIVTGMCSKSSPTI